MAKRGSECLGQNPILEDLAEWKRDLSAQYRVCTMRDSADQYAYIPRGIDLGQHLGVELVTSRKQVAFVMREKGMIVVRYPLVEEVSFKIDGIGVDVAIATLPYQWDDNGSFQGSGLYGDFAKEWYQGPFLLRQRDGEENYDLGQLGEVPDNRYNQIKPKSIGFVFYRPVGEGTNISSKEVVDFHKVVELKIAK